MTFNDFIPPILKKVILKFRPQREGLYGWFGNYTTWEDAQKECTGYDNSILLEKIVLASKLVRDGKAKYERDSCIFEHIEYSWPILAGLLNASVDGNLSIVDFGGSLGSSYYQNKHFFSTIHVKWAVVEQSSFVAIGKQEFTTKNLQFYNKIEDALAIQPKQVLLLSSVIQYLANPKDWIELFLSFDFPYILIDRTSFINTENDRITIQRVPPSIYEASYPCTFFNEEIFVSKFLPKYELIASFPSYCDAETVADDWKRLYWKGFIFKLKD